VALGVVDGVLGGQMLAEAVWREERVGTVVEGAEQEQHHEDEVDVHPRPDALPAADERRCEEQPERDAAHEQHRRADPVAPVRDARREVVAQHTLTFDHRIPASGQPGASTPANGASHTSQVAESNHSVSAMATPLPLSRSRSRMRRRYSAGVAADLPDNYRFRGAWVLVNPRLLHIQSLKLWNGHSPNVHLALSSRPSVRHTDTQRPLCVHHVFMLLTVVEPPA